MKIRNRKSTYSETLCQTYFIFGMGNAYKSLDVTTKKNEVFEYSVYKRRRTFSMNT